MRRSVIDAISDSTESPARHVTTPSTSPTTRSAEHAGPVGGEGPHDVALGDDADDVLAIGRHDECTDAAVAQLGDGVGERGLGNDRGDVGALGGEDRVDVHPADASRAASKRVDGPRSI